MNRIELPSGVKYIINTLNACGYEAVIVGGCVRDALLGLVPKDWDLATDALPEQVKGIFPKTYDTGIRHGTVTIVLREEEPELGCPGRYEITTFRTEGSYSDYRRPDAVFYTKDLSEDLKRRDFTMNAIAYHPDKGFIDPFEGQKDLNSKIIRGVGHPEERFHEDALRMLRAVRFAGQLDFHIEPDTWNALLRCATLIVHVSAERVRDELEKLLLSSHPERALLLNESRLIFHFNPLLGDCLRSREDALSKLSLCPAQLPARLSLILEKTPELRSVLCDLRFDNKTIKTVLLLVWALRQEIPCDFYSIRKQMAYTGIDVYEQALCLRRVRAVDDPEALQAVEALEISYLLVLKGNPCLSIKELAVNGEDLMMIGYQKGEELGEVLQALFEAVLKSPECNTRDNLLELSRGLKNRKGSSRHV